MQWESMYDVFRQLLYLLSFVVLCITLLLKTRKIICLWQCTTQDEIFNLLFQTSYPILEFSFV
jgi:hypothetical protein